MGTEIWFWMDGQQDGKSQPKLYSSNLVFLYTGEVGGGPNMIADYIIHSIKMALWVKYPQSSGNI